MSASPGTPMGTMDSKIKILLVDDDEDFLFQHRIQLENAGYDVTTATTRAKAEEAIATCTPDLAILDLMMEQHDDGFVLSHHLKRAFPGLPVILVTAVTSETGLAFEPSSATERAWVGADAMLAKPIRFEQLRREIDRLLAVRKTR
jgi:CheY-like chemotaxis protein